MGLPNDWREIACSKSAIKILFSLRTEDKLVERELLLKEI